MKDIGIFVWLKGGEKNIYRGLIKNLEKNLDMEFNKVIEKKGGDGDKSINRRVRSFWNRGEILFW